MVVRFDDSIKILTKILVEELGADEVSSGVVLRDVTGRLAYFSSKEMPSRRLSNLRKKLVGNLGNYARPDRVIANRSDPGVEQILSDPAVIHIIVDGQSLKLLDRRIVGADWLRSPAERAIAPPRFVFSSIKGGVGRSTALAIAAADQARQGRRILVVDMDLEAPGLGAMLLEEDSLPEFGLIDALVENAISGLDKAFLADLVSPSPLADHQGRIDVLPAFGRRSINNPADVLAKIARAYTEDINNEGEAVSIMDQMRSLLDHFSNPARYDAILIDARAGLHETTASAIIGLGATVFLFGLDEPQTFQGYSALFAHLGRLSIPDDRKQAWHSSLIMVQGKASEDSEERDAFAEKCRELFSLLQTETLSRRQYVALSSDSFEEVEWDDDVSDEELELNEDSQLIETLFIMDDERFKLFNPYANERLLSKKMYRSSYGNLLEWINDTVTDALEE